MKKSKFQWIHMGNKFWWTHWPIVTIGRVVSISILIIFVMLTKVPWSVDLFVGVWNFFNAHRVIMAISLCLSITVFLYGSYLINKYGTALEKTIGFIVVLIAYYLIFCSLFAIWVDVSVFFYACIAFIIIPKIKIKDFEF